MTPSPQDELFERARRTIRDLREKLNAAEAQNRPEPVAVIGMGIRFPGAGSDLDRFWQMILQGRDAVTEVPPDRWDRQAYYAPEAAVPGKMNTRRAAFLDEVRRFDAGFFDITPREAVRMDPQQRLFLETAWHALEHAGLPRDKVSGTDAGVFVGVHTHSADYQTMQFESPSLLDAYSGSGTAHDMIGGRLAYWLDVHGPALAVNTACSSSLTAVHLACRALRNRDCGLAIVGGVNLMLQPVTTIAAAQLQLLSGDGRCKTFDARADGMGRGEGCGVVILKPLSAALADGDRVLAVIRGSAMNQDGKTNGLIAPNGLAQQRVLRRAFADAKVEPGQIEYVEAHGTGTALGDPIEVEALREVLEDARRTTPCTLGAAKANIGHLEGAAGIAGLIKTVLALMHRKLPPVAGLAKLNPHLPELGKVLQIPQRGADWTGAGPKLAGVSSFGWSGTNVHVVLEEAPAAAVTASGAAFPLLISAHSPEALLELAKLYAERLEGAADGEFADLCYTSAVHRTHLGYRFAVDVANRTEAALVLRRRASASADPAKPEFRRPADQGAPKASPSLGPLLRRWEAGEDLDWAEALEGRGRLIDLPLYPFKGESYWLDIPAPSSAVNTAAVPADWFYSTEWVEPSEPQLATAHSAVTWLLLQSGSNGNLTTGFTEMCRAQGDTVITAERLQPGLWSVAESVEDARVAGELPEIFRALRRSGLQPAQVVFVPGDQDAAEQTGAALEVSQALLESDVQGRLWFLAQSSRQASRGMVTERGFTNAAMQGFSRSLGLEQPSRVGGLIGVDIAAPRWAEALRQTMASERAEDRVLLNANGPCVLRLHAERGWTEGKRLELKQDRCYLVTGAFGRLGRQIASWLVARGARHLALMGKRSPAEYGDPQLLQQLEAWRGSGISVIAEARDVADEASVRAVLARVEASGTGLGGVVHAAAAAQFKPVLAYTERDVESAFRAKVQGARVLDRCTRQRELEFFVLFGSAAATLGLRNGTLYAAANSCLRAVAADRRGLGLAATCIEWGLWAGEGERDQQALIQESGFRPMQPDLALQALELVLYRQQTNVVVADIDWSVLGPALEVRGRHALVSNIEWQSTSSIDPTSSNADQHDAAWIAALHKLPVEERRVGLLDFVGAEVRRVFGMKPGDPLDEDRGLFQMGMDSLMSVRLKRGLEKRVGIRLPGTLTLTYPTVTAIAGFLENSLFAPEPTHGEPTRVAEREAAPTVDDMAGMSDPEVDRAIAEELAALQEKLGVS